MMRTLAGFWMMVALLVGLVGCAGPGHPVRGLVVRGDTPGVWVVPADDPRLSQPGLPGVAVEIVVDPNDIRPTRISVPPTDPMGNFEVGVKQFAAGLLQYEIGVLVRARDHATVYETLPLPSRNQRLYIQLAPGRSTPGPRQDDVEDAMRHMQRFN